MTGTRLYTIAVLADYRDAVWLRRGIEGEFAVALYREQDDAGAHHLRAVCDEDMFQAMFAFSRGFIVGAGILQTDTEASGG